MKRGCLCCENTWYSPSTPHPTRPANGKTRRRWGRPSVCRGIKSGIFIKHFFCSGLPYMIFITFIAHSDADKAFPCLVKADNIGTTNVIRLVLLNRIIFPKTYRANFKCWILRIIVKSPISTAKACVFQECTPCINGTCSSLRWHLGNHEAAQEHTRS